MSDRKHIIKHYGQYSLKLAELLKEGEKLNLEEQVFIENHLVIVQLAIALSKYSGPKKPAQAKI